MNSHEKVLRALLDHRKEQRDMAIAEALGYSDHVRETARLGHSELKGWISDMADASIRAAALTLIVADLEHVVECGMRDGE